MKVSRWSIVVAAFVVASDAVARETVALRGDIVGRLEPYKASYDDTFVALARRFNLGYTELVLANPGVDPWLPGEGTQIILPSAHILPDAPHAGIVINLPEQRLYYFSSDGIRTYPIGIGREGWETPLGTTHISRKRKDPSWTPPASIRAERPDLPAVVAPGPDNPLGQYALYLAWPSYLIHGTNRPAGIGRRVSHGCIRLYPEDIEALFALADIDTAVTVVDQPVKIGLVDGEIYIEAHPTQAQSTGLEESARLPLPEPDDTVARLVEMVGDDVDRIDWPSVHTALRERRGVPILISRRPTLAVNPDWQLRR